MQHLNVSLHQQGQYELIKRERVDKIIGLKLKNPPTRYTHLIITVDKYDDGALVEFK